MSVGVTISRCTTVVLTVFDPVVTAHDHVRGICSGSTAAVVTTIDFPKSSNTYVGSTPVTSTGFAFDIDISAIAYHPETACLQFEFGLEPVYI